MANARSSPADALPQDRPDSEHERRYRRRLRKDFSARLPSRKFCPLAQNSRHRLFQNLADLSGTLRQSSISAAAGGKIGAAYPDLDVNLRVRHNCGTLSLFESLKQCMLRCTADCLNAPSGLKSVWRISSKIRGTAVDSCVEERFALTGTKSDPCCGIDVHKKALVACVRRSTESEIRNYGTTTAEIREMIEWIRDKYQMTVMENTGSR